MKTLGILISISLIAFSCKARTNSGQKLIRNSDDPLLDKYFSIFFDGMKSSLIYENCHIEVRYRAIGDSSTGTLIGETGIPRCDRSAQALVKMQSVADISFRTGVAWNDGEIFVRAIRDGSLWDQELFSASASVKDLMSEGTKHGVASVKPGLIKPDYISMAIGTPNGAEEEIVMGPEKYECTKLTTKPTLGPIWSAKTIEDMYHIKYGIAAQGVKVVSDVIFTLIGGYSTKNAIFGINFDNRYAKSMATQCDNFYPKDSEDWWFFRMRCIASCVNRFFEMFKVQSSQDCNGHAQAFRNVLWYSDTYWSTTSGYAIWTSIGQGKHVFNTVSAVESEGNRRVRYIIDAGWYPSVLFPYEESTQKIHEEALIKDANKWPVIAK